MRLASRAQSRRTERAKTRTSAESAIAAGCPCRAARTRRARTRPRRNAARRERGQTRTRSSCRPGRAPRRPCGAAPRRAGRPEPRGPSGRTRRRDGRACRSAQRRLELASRWSASATFAPDRRLRGRGSATLRARRAPPGREPGRSRPRGERAAAGEKSAVSTARIAFSRCDMRTRASGRPRRAAAEPARQSARRRRPAGRTTRARRGRDAKRAGRRRTP